MWLISFIAFFLFRFYFFFSIILFNFRVISFVSPMLKPLNLIIISVNLIEVNFIVDTHVEVNSVTFRLIFPILTKFKPNLCFNSNHNTR